MLSGFVGGGYVGGVEGSSHAAPQTSMLPTSSRCRGASASASSPWGESPLYVWAREDYEVHWVHALERLFDGSESTALITELYDPLTANFSCPVSADQRGRRQALRVDGAGRRLVPVPRELAQRAAE